MATIRANDGGELLNAEQFAYTKDELGRPVLNFIGAESAGYFVTDGSVPMTGNLQMDGHAIFGVDSISNADEDVAIESNVSMNNHCISDLAVPVKNADAATKQYVDSLIPPFTAEDNGKVLVIKNGQLAWSTIADITV